MPRRIAILTPLSGGPFQWGRQLTEMINRQSGYQATHIQGVWPIIRAQFRVDADLVHTSLPITIHGWRKPIVLTIKGDYTIERRIWRPFYRAAIKTADRLTVPSRFLQARLSLPTASVIPNAIVETNNLTPARSPHRPTRLLCVTVMEFPEKARGLIEMLDILQRRRPDLNDVAVRIVGGGKFLSMVKAHAQKLGFPVEFTGQADPKPHYHWADVFLYYSFHDNMPNTVLEAMSAGLPVVSNIVGALPEMIESGRDGRLCHTAEDYGQAVVDLVQQPELRARLAAGAQARIRQDFSWSRIVERYIAIYDQLLIGQS
jgi:glycosyltransferase involved in cell wall biosynthesis